MQMTVYAEDFQNDPKKYALLSKKYDLYIVRKVSETDKKVKAMKSLFGILPSDIDEEKERAERILKK